MAQKKILAVEGKAIRYDILYQCYREGGAFGFNYWFECLCFPFQQSISGGPGKTGRSF